MKVNVKLKIQNLCSLTAPQDPYRAPQDPYRASQDPYRAPQDPFRIVDSPSHPPPPFKNQKSLGEDGIDVISFENLPSSIFALKT